MKVISQSIYLYTTLILSVLTLTITSAQISSQDFEFQFEGKTLRGLIEKPEKVESKAVVILIPGYGRTNFVEGGWYGNLRKELVEAGLTVCFWDKMGCGQSDGVFNAQQPVENSADEAITAIKEIEKLELAGYEKIGFWGISRAGWIVPLINEKHPIDFWISVSGTDDKENFGYLLKSNLEIAGKSRAEVDLLYQAWMDGHRVSCTNGTYEENQEATLPLRIDSTCQRLFGYTYEVESVEEDKKEYLENQMLYTSKGYFDETSGLWVYIEDFGKMLGRIDCPVLGLFGANDSQVDWRKTKKLYESMIGENPKSDLIIQVFEKCNHSIQKCVTCAWKEDLSALEWQACDGYYDTMKEWLKKNDLVD